MYNGIGLTTPRGSGTNGHVERNWAIVRKTKDKVVYKTDEGKPDILNKQPNKEILEHHRKRKVELKCAELTDVLEQQGFKSDEIEVKVGEYRAILLATDDPKPPQDEFGRINVRETHQIAEAQQQKNAKLREAFGISEFFVEGSSLDPERHVREAEARAAASKVYDLVRTPSPVLDTAIGDTSVVIEDIGNSEKKIKRKRSSSTAKKKKSKKNKRDRSDSPKKKDKSKKKKKHKKHRKEVSSSDSESSDDSNGSSSSEAESKKKRKKRKKKSKSEAKEKHEKKKAPVKRKRQTESECSTDSSPDPPCKASRHEKSSPPPPTFSLEISAASRETARHPRSPKHQSRSLRNSTPPAPRRRNSPPQVIAIAHRRPGVSDRLVDRFANKSPPARRDQRSPAQSSHRNRSPSRTQDQNRPPRRYSRNRRGGSPSPPRRRRALSRSPRCQTSRSPSRSRYDRYAGRARRSSPPRRRRSRSPRRRGRECSALSRSRRAERSPCDRRKSSKSRSHSHHSSLSYSPVRKNPDRYKDILHDDRQAKKATLKCRDNDDKRGSPKAKSRVAPRVSLRSTSEDEADITEDEPKVPAEDDEERQREINTLKRLQSGLAAKARESLGKKVISPTKIKIERRDDSIGLLDIALPSEPPKGPQEISGPRLQSDENSKSRSSSRSPSLELPSTRVDAVAKIRSPSESPLPLSTGISSRSPQESRRKNSPVRIRREVKSPSTVIVSSIQEVSNVKLRSPIESPPHVVTSPINLCPIKHSLSSPSSTRKFPRKSSKKSSSRSRSRSRSYTRSRSVEKRLRISSPTLSSGAGDKKSRSPSPGLKKSSVSPLRRLTSRSPAKQSPKLSVRSKRSRDSRSSSIGSNLSASSRLSRRDKKKMKKSVSRSPMKKISRSRSRSTSMRLRSRSPPKKSRSRSRSVLKNSRDKAKRSRSGSSSRSSRSSTRRSRRSFTSSSRSSSSGSIRSSRLSSSSSGSSRSRSPSIPRRHGSPSFLDRRRITSARKRPIPYHRPTPSPPSSPSSSASSRHSDWSSPSRRSSRSPTRSPSSTR